MASGPIEAGLALFVATFRAELDSYQVKAYKRALEGIAADVLLPAADSLIDQAAAGRKFYPLPNPPQWKEACATVIAAKRRQAFQIGIEGCDHPSFMESYKDDDGIEWTRRCACYKRGKLLQEAAGAPLALPSWTDPDPGD